MSAATHLEAPASRRTDVASSAPVDLPPRLRVVPRGTPRLGRNAFGLLIGALLGCGLMAVLLLNTVLAQGAFAIHSLEQEATALEIQQQALEQEVALLETPGSLARRARDLGMVRSPLAAFLRLSDGQVLGVPTVTPGRPRTLGRVVAAAPAAPAAAAAPAAPAAPAASAAPDVPAAPGDGAVATGSDAVAPGDGAVVTGDGAVATAEGGSP